MRVMEKTRREIEAKFNSMGDYVKIDYLRSCLKSDIDYDTKKFVLVKLSGLYENKRMYLDAGKMMKVAADINTTIKAKIEDFLKSAELFIRGGHYDYAEGAIKSAISVSNEREKFFVKDKYKEMFFTQAKNLAGNDKRKQAAEIYQKMLSLELNTEERRNVNENLLGLYDKLGKVRDYYFLKKQMGLNE